MAGKYVASPVAIEQGQLVAYAALATMAIVPIYFGSRASLKKWKNIKDKSATKTGDNESTEQDDVKSESLSIDDAITFPIFGSLGLVGLHLAYKHWDKTYINYASTAYFALVGILALAQVGVNTISPIVKMLGLHIEPYHITLSRRARDVYSAKFSVLHLSMMIVSILLSAYYAATKDWIASNIFAVTIALNGIQLLSLDSFKTGITLIVGFCLYEVAWAKYGVEILASVAKNMDAPLKVVFPWLIFGLPAGQTLQFAKFGLGDIVVPGLFAALCLRFDQHLAGNKNSALGRSTRFAKPYFIACLVAYLLGLGCSFYLEHTMQISLPMILYLGPACILSVFMTGSVRGQMQSVFGYISEEGLEARAKRLARIKSMQSKRREPVRAPKVRLPAVIKEETFVPRGSPTDEE
ncbi:hypothetical protein BGZ74_007055 [Mortierella antarctica]|nr:hypothetical protein BGZ74_007055 [Mortierella antarctica]